MTPAGTDTVQDGDSVTGAATDRPANVLDVAERRLVRLGFDIHDGPVQDAAALLADVSFVRKQLAATMPVAAESLRDVEARLLRLHEELRELAHSLESRALVERKLREVLKREAVDFRRRCDIELDLDVSGDLAELTASQRTATARIVQEAMSNIREHSGARHAQVRVRTDDEALHILVWDDGTGFDAARALREPRHGGLGLVGMRERARLLDGTLDLDTRPGGPTRVTVRLPRWRPTPVENSTAS